MIELSWANENWWALAERALFRPKTNTLFIADPHFGKDESFRVAGVGLPAGTLSVDLARLSEALTKTLADQLIILGDFYHDKAGVSELVCTELEQWFHRHQALDVILIRGNHDTKAGDPPARLKIRCTDDPTTINGVLCAHIPPQQPQRPTLAGHLHPSVSLGGAGLRRKYACFHLRRNLALLPAFGSFTGTARLTVEPEDQIIIVDQNKIAKIA
ncbi:MAG: ligase-associated DNA damage response endonuclease PdeM [Sumerlaeia bacterium]